MERVGCWVSWPWLAFIFFFLFTLIERRESSSNRVRGSGFSRWRNSLLVFSWNMCLSDWTNPVAPCSTRREMDRHLTIWKRIFFPTGFVIYGLRNPSPTSQDTLLRGQTRLTNALADVGF